MWDLIVSVPDHCLSFYSPCISNKEIRNAFFFLICYETALDRKNICHYASTAKRRQMRYIPSIYLHDYSK